MSLPVFLPLYFSDIPFLFNIPTPGHPLCIYNYILFPLIPSIDLYNTILRCKIQEKPGKKELKKLENQKIRETTVLSFLLNKKEMLFP